MRTSRTAARANGELKYNTGKQCKNGHSDDRWTSNTHCISCDRSHQKAKRDKDPERNRNRVKKWQKENPQKHAAKTTAHFRFKKYGITALDYEKLLAEQGSCCAICETSFPKTPNVDHCHTTGVIRGLLCNQCNQGLGLFHDSIQKLENAINYLRKSK